MSRKLASIRKINSIKPIENADRLELAIVDGWKVVVRKEEYHEGDTIIYCEVDSYLPIKPEFEFLRNSSYKKLDGKEGFRLRSIKIRNQISQGLILPISLLPVDVVPIEGLDVTEELGITKWELPIPARLAGIMKGGFPSFIPKTDAERVQNLVSDWFNWRTTKFWATEKLDGSSATYYFRDGEFGVCSRNWELKETDDNTFWQVARQLNIEDKLRTFGRNIALQGELIGESIQGNRYSLRGQTVRFFNIFDIDEHRNLDITSFKSVLDILGLNSVPFINSFEMPSTIDELLFYSIGKSALEKTAEREGIVVRNFDGSILFKAISNKFLLEEA